MTKTNPSSLDILDSQIPSSQRQAYKEYLSTLNSKNSWEFSIVPNYFKQSLFETDEDKFDYLSENFGRLHSWDEIIADLNKSNKESDDDTQYKIFILARHGFGYHNWAHAHYGDNSWNEHWSRLNGNGEVTWGPDANLTEFGISQARENNKEWKNQIDQGLIKPKRFFTSPLSRCIDTLLYTFEDIVDLKQLGFLVEENWRETMGVHTCDKRSTKEQLLKRFEEKGIQFEKGFVNDDIYWQNDYRESIVEHAIRINKGFQNLFNEVSKTDDIISITSHSGSLRSELMVLGHRSFAVGTGGLIPVFVKATKKK
ncbi:unnamed protein product [Candida verbasci]|uniref:Phosphoglycerate mutase n=1 Tax=Candida verbasci TaxID=1227364 RepID=A0A9W4TX78_9ASCO|nr:unnamed protein product [Candida verbasci]